MRSNNIFFKYHELSKSENDSKSNHEATENSISEILDTHYKPVEKNDGNHSTTLKASTKQATEMELNKLEHKLNQKLEDYKLAITGFEPRLWDIYSDLLNELIRQEIISSPERGLLWLKIKNEIQITLKSLEKCHKSCFAYGVNKHLQYSTRINSMRSEISELKKLARLTEDNINTRVKEWEERKKEFEKEKQIKTIQWNFFEDQITKANDEIEEQLVQRYDPEHRWLKDIDFHESPSDINIP